MSNLCYLLQQLKLLNVVVPLDPQAVWYWFQTPPHVRQAPTNNALPSVTAQEVTWQQVCHTGAQCYTFIRTQVNLSLSQGQRKETFSYTFPGNSEEGRHETTTSFCGGKEDHVFRYSVITHLLMTAGLQWS